MTNSEKQMILNFIKLVRVEQDRRIAENYPAIAHFVALKSELNQLAEAVGDISGIDFDNFVTKDGNKQLSTNDFSDAEKALLANLATEGSEGFTEADFLSVFADD